MRQLPLIVGGWVTLPSIGERLHSMREQPQMTIRCKDARQCLIEGEPCVFRKDKSAAAAGLGMSEVLIDSQV